MPATIHPPELDRRPGDRMTTQIHGLKTAATALTAPLGPIAGLGRRFTLECWPAVTRLVFLTVLTTSQGTSTSPGLTSLSTHTGVSACTTPVLRDGTIFPSGPGNDLDP